MRLCAGITAALLAISAGGCAAPPPVRVESLAPDLYGTLEPFASESVYFVVTDRFVDGDPANNHEDQGGTEVGTFDRPIQLTGQGAANIGYLGGDFKGIVQHAGYIADMGFTALWITPIVDNPDEAFTGSTRPGEGAFADKGKSGYHGYWGVNFFRVDEHLESPGLTFADMTRTLREDYGLKLVLDIVCNHGSPAYTMPSDQPKFGEIYDADGRLLADHQNLHPTELDPGEPLHAFFNRKPDLAQLADMNESNPEVLEYFVAAYLRWLGQGAYAFRIDTIKHMPHAFWKAFSDRIRAVHPDLFMFAESWSYDAAHIAEHTWPENGGISVLDFPGQQAMNDVFAAGAPYARLTETLHLDTGIYQNPYELMTFYDNHDMARMDADADGFIDANNWLFTSRGIPVVYYGSELGFQAGAREHGGNRNYFGAENIARAKRHRIHTALSRVAKLRSTHVALQRGLQLNLDIDDDMAAFYRIYRYGGQTETALVLLNKGDDAANIAVSAWMSGAGWMDALTGGEVDAAVDSIFVPGHDLRVFVSEQLPNDPAMLAALERLQARANRD